MNLQRVILFAPAVCLLLASCEDKEDALPFVTEAELNGVTFGLRAVREVFKSPRSLDSCSRGDACTTYEGRFRVRIETDRAFGPVDDATLERGPNLLMFGLTCSPFLAEGTDLLVVAFECPYGEGRAMPTSGSTISFAPRLAGLYETYPGVFDFPGSYDPATFPSIAID